MNAKKTKNPVLQQKFEEGFNEGYRLGHQQGINHATTFLAKQFEVLKTTPGIGPKTLEKFKQAFGEQYFR